MIAMALAGSPSLILADEPTTALDVTVQARILELLRDCAARRASAMLLVSHDLRVIAHVADQVVVMYAGRVVERGPAARCCARPRTRTPGRSWPACPAVRTKTAHRRPAAGRAGHARRPALRLPVPPALPDRLDRCATERPALREVAPGPLGACHSLRRCWDEYAEDMACARRSAVLSLSKGAP